MRLPISILAGLVLLAACDRSPQAPSPSTQAHAPQAPVTAPVADPSLWVGRWQGPEGTYLAIAKDGEAYQITISNLDGPRTFLGRVGGDGLEFERDGVSESIRPGSGAQTGMKWLAHKTDCLVIKPGEGYCRA